MRGMRWIVAWCVALGLVAGLGRAEAGCLKEIFSGEVICGAGRCEADARGRIACAPTRHGTIVKRVDGSLACGMGECAETAVGEIVCSTIDGGAVLREGGRVRCYGACASASPRLCERTIAGR